MPREKRKSLYRKKDLFKRKPIIIILNKDLDGKITIKTSHTKKMKDIPDNILAQMAKQCHLSKSEFLDLIDCPLDQEKYEVKLRNQGILPPKQQE